MSKNIEIYRTFKPFDLWGWIMCLLGISLMCKFGGIGWIFGTDKNWWMFAAVFFFFWDHVIRVSFGRITKVVYYNTVVNNMYELLVDGGEKFYVCAASEEELDLYMGSYYPELKYKIVDETLVESFLKEDIITN